MTAKGSAYGGSLEAERLRRIVEPRTLDGFWTADQVIGFDQWREHFHQLRDAPRHLPVVIAGVVWRYERAK